ncbi:hypothetical protein, partial [Gordonia terrae]|uniref:hypothetical protein n=1 Tax=Gordonia terrae TaxID=2055 RepID=UPI001C5D6730
MKLELALPFCLRKRVTRAIRTPRLAGVRAGITRSKRVCECSASRTGDREPDRSPGSARADTANRGAC